MTWIRGRRYPPRSTGRQVLAFALVSVVVIVLLMALALKVAA